MTFDTSNYDCGLQCVEEFLSDARADGDFKRRESEAVTGSRAPRVPAGPNNSTLPTGMLASFNPPNNAWPAGSASGPAGVTASFNPPMRYWFDLQR